MISLNNLHFSINRLPLLSEINTEIPRGCFTAILGNNGAGKSTLLKLLTGELKGYQGTYFFDGERAESYPIRKWAIKRAVLPQMHITNADYSARDVILLGALPHTAQATLVNQKVSEIIVALRLEALLHKLVNQLSGGELQKVQLARVLLQAFLSPPPHPYLFLDEPANHLDLRAQNEIFNYLKTLSQKGFGVVSVIHDINLAARFADHIILLKKGSIVKAGPLDHCLCAASLSHTFDCPMQEIKSEGLACPLFIPELQLETSIN